MSLHNYRLTKNDGSTNTAVSKRDIWTGTPGVASVNDLGPVPVVKPAPASAYRELTPAGFRAYLATLLTVQRFRKIDKDTKAATTDDNVWLAYEGYLAAQSMTHDDELTVAYLGVLEASGIITDVEAASILDNWPVA